MNEKDLRPDWVRARDEGRELTLQQRIAEATRGVVRLPNLMTATGVGLTMLSAVKARENKPVAAGISAAAGFALDMEGAVARRFEVTDPKWGGRIDRAADGAKAIITAHTLLESDILPPAAAALTYAPKAAGAGAWAVAKHRGRPELSSSLAGKAAEWPRDIAPLGFLLASAGRKFDVPVLERTGNVIGWGSAGLAAALGSVAAAGYYLEAFAGSETPDGPL